MPSTSLIGREELAARVAAQAPACRLVSLLGPGGVGKTRLLLEVGRILQVEDPDRPVVLCELAGADDAAAPHLLAAALGVDARPGLPLPQQLATVVGDAPLVLLVDNCEHVLVPVAEVLEHLLARCSQLTVLVTSRERLRLAGEHLCPVPALEVRGHDAPAVHLFLERTRAIAPDFAPDDRELAVVEEIVQRVDGLPLAIELAAARLHTHDVREVAAGLDQRFSLLTAGVRTSPRHASLGAAVWWSFSLLDDTQQRVFSDLSVFVGPFTAEDAAAICDLDPATTVDALSQLVERSLLLRTPDRRYALLETLRAFGHERLTDAGRHQRVADRHARHLVERVERAHRRLAVPGSGAIAEIDGALPELHAALGWLVDQDDVELAGRLVKALLDYGFLRLRPDVLAWAERVMALDPDDRHPTAAGVLVTAAYASWMAGDLGETAARAMRATAASERSTGGVSAVVASARASVDLFEGRVGDAARWFRHAVDAAPVGAPHRRIAGPAEVLALGYAGAPEADARAAELLDASGGDETPYAAYAWYCAGEVDLVRGELDRARTRFDRAIELAERTNASFIAGLAGASRASIEARVGDPRRAADDFRGLIDHWRRAGMWSTQWTMLRSIARLIARLGRHRDAAVLVGAVQATDAGHRIFGADEVALQALGRQLRDVLGDDVYEAASAEGARLDGDAAVEHARRSL